MSEREKERGYMEGGMMTRRRKGGRKWKRYTSAEASGMGGEKRQLGSDITNRNQMNTTPNEPALSTNSQTDTTTNRGHNRFMALENLLNQQEKEKGRWADMVIEEQGTEQQQNSGNVL